MKIETALTVPIVVTYWIGQMALGLSALPMCALAVYNVERVINDGKLHAE